MAAEYLVINETDSGTFQRKLLEHTKGSSGRVIASNAYFANYSTNYYALIEKGGMSDYYLQEIAGDVAQIALSASSISVNTQKYY